MLALWKISYDQPRQHIKKQRHYFVNKGPSSQGYGFSNGHVWMWELDYKESWAPKNWCFWTVVLEKTLRVPWTARRSNQSILKKISPEYSLERLLLKLKLQYFGHLVECLVGLLTCEFYEMFKEGAKSNRCKLFSKVGCSVQLLTPVWLFVTPWTAACQAYLSITNSRSLLKTHVHHVCDVIQPSQPLLSPSPPAFNLSQHQALFKCVSSSHQVAKVLELQLKHQSFQPSQQIE